MEAAPVVLGTPHKFYALVMQLPRYHVFAVFMLKIKLVLHPATPSLDSTKRH